MAMRNAEKEIAAKKKALAEKHKELGLDDRKSGKTRSSTEKEVKPKTK